MNLPPIIIAKKIGMAKSTISKFLQDPENYGRKNALNPRPEGRTASYFSRKKG
jgi:hypothetical protein